MGNDPSRFWWRLKERIPVVRIRGSLMALCIYTLAAIVVFYPVPFHLNTVLAGFSFRDGWEHAWWPWFSHRLLLEGRGLDDLYLLNHPAGLTHPYQWSLTGFTLICFPVASLFPPAATFNLLVLSSFVLSGLAAYHLCRELTGSHWAAVAGGGVFSFCSNRFGHALAGWLPQMMTYVYPWYALLLIRTLRCPTLRRSVGLGLLAALGATMWPIHIVYLLLPLTIVIVGAEILQRGRSFFQGSSINHLSLALLITLAVALPFLLPVIVRRVSGDLDYLSLSGVVGHSTDLLAYLTPSRYHPVFARLGIVPSFANRVFKDRETLRAALAYPGLLAVLLATWGTLRTKPCPWRWVALALSTAMLSLGPILVWGGRPLEYTVDGYQAHVLLPYQLVQALPFLDWVRTPGRINTTAMLAVGVLVAYGTADLLHRFDGSWLGTALLPVCIFGFAVFECLPVWPFPAGDATIPPVIQRIADQRGKGALLHIPMRRRRVNNRALYYQTATKQPIVGGIVLRELPQVTPWEKTIQGLLKTNGLSDIVPRPDISQRAAWLRHFQVDWALLHKLEQQDVTRYQPFIEKVLGPPVVEDETFSAYRIPDQTPPVDDAILYTLGEHGWQRPEEDGDLWRRWMSDDGQLYIYAPEKQTGALRFTVDSHLNFPLLEVYQGEDRVNTFVTGERTAYTTDVITLTKGINVFRFHAPGGCPKVLDDPRCWSAALLHAPEEGPPPCDAQTTCRTFVFDTIRFVPENHLTPSEVINVRLGSQIELHSWSVETPTVSAGNAFTVKLVWTARAEMSERYVVFVHLLSSDGQLVAQNDSAPVKRLLPNGTWPPGSTFGYTVTIELPDHIPAGQYPLRTGVYLWPERDRLTVASSPDNTLGLGVIEVLP